MVNYYYYSSYGYYGCYGNDYYYYDFDSFCRDLCGGHGPKTASLVFRRQDLVRAVNSIRALCAAIAIAYIVMAYIVMVYIVMANLVIIFIVMGHIVMAYIVVAPYVQPSPSPI